MQNLKVIENELVPVYETSTGEKVVYGTELHAALDVKSRFNDWVRNRVADCEAVENEDYETFTKNLVSGGQAKEYIIKLDIAKEMAMLERNEKGKQVRKYFIAIEKKYKAVPKPPVTPMNLSPQLQLLINMELKQKEQDAAISELKEKTDKLEYDIPLYGSEADGICNHVKRKGVEMLGGKQSNAYKDNKIRHAVYSDIYNQIKREFGLYDDKGRYKSYKALKRRYIYDAHEVISAYELPAYLAERIRDCNAQINMEVA